jgi:HD-like signal output (HDOD) protein
MTVTTLSEAELLQAAQELPAAPRLLVELGQAIRNPAVDAHEVTALLRQDPSLVSRLIRMANSALYARAEPAGSIEEAIACIGFREVHRLVGAIAAAHLADVRLAAYGVDGARMRANCLFVAVVMEELAEPAGEEPRSCYTAGLLRSLGKMALQKLADQAGSTLSFATGGERELAAWEEAAWGTSNCTVAARILAHWRLPGETVTAIRDHYHPAGRHNPITHLLNLAAGAAEHRCFGLPGEELYWQFTPENFVKAGLDLRRFQALTERAQRTYQRLHSAVV